MELNWLNTSGIVTISVIAARITDILKIFDNSLGLLKKGKTPEVYNIESSNLMRSSNPRFGFSYIEPRTWDRLDPDNRDGNKYVHPTKSDVSFSVSGMHDVFTEKDIYTTIEKRLKELKKEKNFKLLLNRPSGTYYYDFPDENTVETKKINAWRLKYKLKDKLSGNHITVIEYRCNYDNMCFVIYCQTKNKDFEKFEDFFLFVISEFRILGVNSAPMARSRNDLNPNS